MSSNCLTTSRLVGTCSPYLSVHMPQCTTVHPGQDTSVRWTHLKICLKIWSATYAKEPFGTGDSSRRTRAKAKVYDVSGLMFYDSPPSAHRQRCAVLPGAAATQKGTDEKGNIVRCFGGCCCVFFSSPFRGNGKYDEINFATNALWDMRALLCMRNTFHCCRSARLRRTNGRYEINKINILIITYIWVVVDEKLLVKWFLIWMCSHALHPWRD